MSTQDNDQESLLLKHPDIQIMREEERLASEIIRVMFKAEKDEDEIHTAIRSLVRTNGWYERLAQRILDKLVEALKKGAQMGRVMKKAFNKASEKAEEFVKDHPVFTAVLVTVVAIGILVLLVPWVVEALGFGELGPIEGKKEF